MRCNAGPHSLHRRRSPSLFTLSRPHVLSASFPLRSMDTDHDSVSRRNGDIANYPFLSPDEFVATCHHLDRKYCQAELGPVRRRWKLRLCTALDTTLSFNGTYATYVQIVRPLETSSDSEDLSAQLASFAISPEDPQHALPSADEDTVADEESDEASSPRPRPRQSHVFLCRQSSDVLRQAPRLGM